MRAIDKEIISQGKYYEKEKFLFYKKCLDINERRVLKIVTSEKRIDTAFKKSITMYTASKLKQGKSLLEHIQITDEYFKIYEDLKSDIFDKKEYYQFEFPRWVILIAISNAKPKTKESFTEIIMKSIIELMGELIPVELNDEKINRKHNKRNIK
ncbi:MAG: hypothetical protein ACRCX8_12265 [Sarcina sp.]